jgi:hypothetical protein
MAALEVLLGGGYLGKHLCFVLGVEVNRTAWGQPPQQWARRCWPTPNWPMGNSAGPTRAAYRSAVPERRNGVCPGQHLRLQGGALQEGAISDGCVTLPMAR